MDAMDKRKRQQLLDDLKQAIVDVTTPGKGAPDTPEMRAERERLRRELYTGTMLTHVSKPRRKSK